MRHWARRLCAVGAVATVAVAILAVPSPAAAQVETIHCTGSSDQTFDPGLTLTVQDVLLAATDNYDDCTSTSTSNPNITEGVAVYSNEDVPLSCNSVQPGTDAYTVEWNDGSSSTISLTFAIVAVAAQTVISLTGTVTSGVLEDGTATGLLVYPTPNLLDCVTPGVTSQEGDISLTIIRI